jgi:hypothetical protein
MCLRTNRRKYNLGRRARHNCGSLDDASAINCSSGNTEIIDLRGDQAAVEAQLRPASESGLLISSPHDRSWTL